jgi:hypothetical protein
LEYPIYNTQDTDNVYNTWFKINIINKTVHPQVFELRELIEGDAVKYLLPLAKVGNIKGLDSIVPVMYLDEEYKYIYLVFRFTPFNWYLSVKDMLKASPAFHSSFKDNSNKFDIFQYRLDAEGKEVCNYFMKGQFHYFPDSYKKKMINFYKLNIQDRKYKIIMNDAKLRQELSDLYHNGTVLPDKIGLATKPKSDIEIWQNSGLYS